MRYLLGSLSQDERNRLEEDFFADDAKFAELEVLEDELIDYYVAGELSPDQRRQFETQLRKSPRLVERVHFARALAEKVATLSLQPQAALGPAVLVSPSIPPPKARWWEVFSATPAFRMALAACLVLLLLGGAALLAGWLRLRGESERLNSERAALQQKQAELARQLSVQQARGEQQSAELQREREERAEDLKLIEKLQRAAESKEQTSRLPGLTAFAFLTPGSLRSAGAEPAQLTIRPQTRTARLELALEKNDYPAYEAAIKYYERVVFRQRRRAHVTRSGPQLLLSFASKLLQANRDYVVHVDGVTRSGELESVSDYQFRVINESR